MTNDAEKFDPAGNSASESTAIAVVDRLAPNGWRLKLAKATSQILLGTRAGAAFYAEAREHLDVIEGRSAMNKQLYAIAAQQIISDPEMIERAKARLVGDALRRQENLENVLKRAEDGLLALPPPDEASTDNGYLAGSPAQQDSSDAPLDQDWANSFTSLAEDASSEQLRELLSKILVGEIKSRGAFPRSIVRTIFELEQQDVRSFFLVLPYVFGNKIIMDESIDIKTIESLSDAGILDYLGIVGSLTGWQASPGSPGAIAGNEFAAIMDAIEPVNLSIPTVALTRLGRALVRLLDGSDEERAIIE